ncbi:unnamed protein product [Paramecium octaurelia]|uniref:Uncharacterized protein n=1 Tax=Paramecium octaurelia TaxID=43137 RepID=A0A8S1Y0W3_PAROT|nr:unnamed protein product [Paramecium octaurelia]
MVLLCKLIAKHLEKLNKSWLRQKIVFQFNLIILYRHRTKGFKLLVNTIYKPFVKCNELILIIIYIQLILNMLSKNQLLMNTFMNLLFLTNQTVIYQFDANVNNIDDWKSSNGNYQFTSCGGIPYFYSTRTDILIQLNISIIQDYFQISNLILTSNFENSWNTFYLDLIKKNYQIKNTSSYSFGYGSSSTQFIQIISISLSHKRKSFGQELNISRQNQQNYHQVSNVSITVQNVLINIKVSAQHEKH